MRNDPMALAILPRLRMSARLAAAMERTMGLAWPLPADGHADRLVWATHAPPYDLGIRAEARDIVEELAPFAMGASKSLVGAWIAPLFGAVRNPPPREQQQRWLSAAMMVLECIESGAFNEQTQRQALEQIEFWPAPAQIYEIVLPAAIMIRVQIALLRRIADGVSAPIFGA